MRTIGVLAFTAFPLHYDRPANFIFIDSYIPLKV